MFVFHCECENPGKGLCAESKVPPVGTRCQLVGGLKESGVRRIDICRDPMNPVAPIGDMTPCGPLNAIILHELVHWCRFIGDESAPLGCENPASETVQEKHRTVAIVQPNNHRKSQNANSIRKPLLPAGTSVEGRPRVIHRCRRCGDWEGDTIVGHGRRSALLRGSLQIVRIFTDSRLKYRLRARVFAGIQPSRWLCEWAFALSIHFEDTLWLWSNGNRTTRAWARSLT